MGALKLGPWEIDPPLYLAPMAGHTNRAFRELCRELGGVGLVCTELISSRALKPGDFDFDAGEAPVAVQLFGADPELMAEAARMVADHGASIVDINMGCWVPKVVKKGGGAALLGDVCQAGRVVEAVVAAVTVPVTVKVRSGLTADALTAVPFARLAESLGVSAISVHARTAEQGFSGFPDWTIIRDVCEAVSIPVFGNGDLTCKSEAVEMQRLSGCQGWMVGRAALGAPWLFAAWQAGVEEVPPLEFRRAVARRHVELTQRWSPLSENQAVRELRGQLSRYALGMREAVIRLNTYAEALELLQGCSWWEHPWAEQLKASVGAARTYSH